MLFLALDINKVADPLSDSSSSNNNNIGFFSTIIFCETIIRRSTVFIHGKMESQLYSNAILVFVILHRRFSHFY